MLKQTKTMDVTPVKVNFKIVFIIFSYNRLLVHIGIASMSLLQYVPTSCHSLFKKRVTLHTFCRLLIFFSKSIFLKNSFRNTIRVSNSFDPDQA